MRGCPYDLIAFSSICRGHWEKAVKSAVVLLDMVKAAACTELKGGHHVVPPIIGDVQGILQCQQCLHAGCGEAALEELQMVNQVLQHPHI